MFDVDSHNLTDADPLIIPRMVPGMQTIGGHNVTDVMTFASEVYAARVTLDYLRAHPFATDYGDGDRCATTLDYASDLYR